MVVLHFVYKKMRIQYEYLAAELLFMLHIVTFNMLITVEYGGVCVGHLPCCHSRHQCFLPSLPYGTAVIGVCCVNLGFVFTQVCLL
jgi:hypothetical protein